MAYEYEEPDSARDEKPKLTGHATVPGITRPVRLVLLNTSLRVYHPNGTIHRHALPAGVIISTLETSALQVQLTFPANGLETKDDVVLIFDAEFTAKEWMKALQECVSAGSAAIEGAEWSFPNTPADTPDLPSRGLRSTFTLESTETSTSMLSLQDVDVQRRNLRDVIKSCCKFAASFIAFAAIYTVASRSPYAVILMNNIAWAIAQHGYHLFPWPFTSRMITVLFTAVVVAINWTLMMVVLYLQTSGTATTNPTFVALATVRTWWFAFTMLYGISIVYYVQAKRNGKIPASEPIIGPKGCCQRDTARVQFGMSILAWIIVPLTEAFAAVENKSQQYTTITTIFYVSIIVFGAAITYIGRRQQREYYFALYVRFLPTLAFATVICGRLTNMIIMALQARLANDRVSFDSYLPFVFVFYKMLFMGIYPYFSSIVVQMGRKEDSMMFMYPVQVMDALVLDAFAIVSPTLSSYHIFFVIARVVFAVAYQAGFFRLLTDKAGLTTRSWSTYMPTRVHDSSSSLSKDEFGMKVRRTHGDAPLAQWLFFVQGSLAGLLSVTTLMGISALDAVFPGQRVLTGGANLNIILIRAVISLLAWMLTVTLTFAIARRRMLKAGFTASELVAQTAIHFKNSNLIMLTYSWPVITYVMTFTAAYIQALNGASNPLAAYLR